MSLAAFNFETGKLSGRVELSVADEELGIIEIPSRFSADTANVGRIMFRCRLAPGETRGGAIVRIYNDAEDGQIIRQASIASSSACVEPITGGCTMPTVGGIRATAEIIGTTPVEVDCLIDPSTGGVPSANPFTVASVIVNAGQAEFGPAPMDCTAVFIQLADNLVGASNVVWADNAGAAVVTTGIPAGSSPFISMIPAGGRHLVIQNGGGAPETAIVTWS